MEGRRARAVIHPHIKWTPPLEGELLEMGMEERKMGKGYQKRLTKRWATQHPNLPSTTQALCGKFRKLEKARETLRVRAAPESDAESGSEECDSEYVSPEEMANEVESELPDPPDELTEEIGKVYSTTLVDGEGRWGPRANLTRRWKGNREALGSLDRAMARMWEARNGSTLWELNCLLYAGAVVAEGLERKTSEEVSEMTLTPYPQNKLK